MRRCLYALALMAAPLAAAAQTSDRDYLTALLEDNLSGAGRQVVITGFEGALSSQARIAQMTIADDIGVWLTLNDVALDWTRSDLLLGKVTVNTLSAAEINLARLPQSQADITAEAAPFALPSLPVSIDIGSISAQTLHLGAPILGQEVTASIAASLTLAAGQGQGSLHIERLGDGAAVGQADVAVSFANDSQNLGVDIQIAEGQGGILAPLIGIAGAPAVQLTAKGDGPLDDFLAQITLASDGAPRFGGTVKLSRLTDADAPARRAFAVDLAGDLTPLMAPAYRPFFGDTTALRAAGQSRAAGGFDLDTLRITSQALDVTGSLSVAASGVPSQFDLHAVARDPGGAPLILPLGLDMPAAISAGDLHASFDAAKGDAWQLNATLTGWTQDDLRVSQTQVTGAGTLRDAGQQADFAGKFDFAAEGVQPARAALSRAIGSVVWGGGTVAYRGGALTLSQVTVSGDDYQIALNGVLDDLTKGLAFNGTVTATAQDMSRFSGLLGRPVAGAGQLSYQGRAVVLTRAFDGAASVQTTDLALGIAALDSSLAGPASLNVQARRGEDGIEIAAIKLRSAGAQFDLAGRIAAAGVSLAGDFALLDLPTAARGFGGVVAGKLALSGTPMDALASISAHSSGIDVPTPMLQKLVSADADFTAEVALKNAAPTLLRANLASAAVTADIAPAGTDGSFDIRLGLANLAMIVPEFPGPLTATGRAKPQGDGADLDIAITGPAGLNAQVLGQVSATSANNLRLNGQADAGIINAFIAPRSISGAASFDLALRRAANLAGVSGRIAVKDGRLADPSLPFSLRKIAATATLTAGRIGLDGTANATSGGDIDLRGRVSAYAPYDADLQIAVRALGLRDPDLYDSSVAGNLHLKGALMGGATLSGALDLGRTEVQLKPTDAVPATLPTLTHVGDSAAMQATRTRAGYDLRAAAAGTTTPIALNITVRAPSRLFVRGRGLDAELGGAVRLAGTTNDVRPDGAFDLVRGRFDILTKRLDLEEVRLEMQGQLIPYLSVRATNLRGDVTTTVIIDGPATDPEFSFTSSPELPEEEILAALLFDQNLQGLSALQAVQLTGAIATLSGRGDGVIGRIRRTLKLDNLDLQTDQTGKTALKLGKYVSDNVYSELSGDSGGQQSLDFTYTLNSKIKLRAGAETTGNARVGIEFETNY